MNHQRIKPGPGQESVWDYPRPPRVEDSDKHIQVVFAGVTIADTRRAKQVLETSHPPVYYIPTKDIRMQHLAQTNQASWCEWKGLASYYNIDVDGRQAANAAWFYPVPAPAYAAIRDHVAFYPQQMDACYVNGEKVKPQPGDFYGGWITNDIVGPFKGGLGTANW